MDEQTQIIIFGGSGFIGTHLVNTLYTSNPNVQIINADLIPATHDGKSRYVFCDVRQAIDLDGITLKQDDLIINLAAIHRTPGHRDEEYFETNLKGAQNVCDFAVRHRIRSIVFTSSIAPYGASEELKSEQTLPLSNTPYGISKLVAEKIHEIWRMGDSNRNLLIVRPGAVFGKGEKGNFTRLYWALRKRRFMYPGRRDTIKSCIYVKDLVAFMLSRLPLMNGGYFELYNCAYHPAYRINQIVHTIACVTKVPEAKMRLSGRILKALATILGLLGGQSWGVHPDRVRKLMVSTNIDATKMANTGFVLPFGLEKGFEDWFQDNQCTGLE